MEKENLELEKENLALEKEKKNLAEKFLIRFLREKVKASVKIPDDNFDN